MSDGSEPRLPSPVAEVVIRPVSEVTELEACVQLQVATWGYDPADVVPRRLFSLAGRIGGQVLGAFLGERLVGFLLALPAHRNGHGYLHSHMLAVVPDVRDHGIGQRLKLAQRDDALARGIELIEWTFDPLVIKNAHLNLNRLGAVARRYAHDFYGPTSSPLQGGLPTDRLYAEWWLRSERVRRALEGSQSRTEVLQRLAVDCVVVERVSVPAALAEWKGSAEGRARARAVQAANAKLLEASFAAGLSALAFGRLPNGDGSYQLAKWDEPYRL